MIFSKKGFVMKKSIFCGVIVFILSVNAVFADDVFLPYTDMTGKTGTWQGSVLFDIPLNGWGYDGIVKDQKISVFLDVSAIKTVYIFGNRVCKIFG